MHLSLHTLLFSPLSTLTSLSLLSTNDELRRYVQNLMKITSAKLDDYHNKRKGQNLKNMIYYQRMR